MKNNKSEYNKLFNLSHKSDYYLTNNYEDNFKNDEWSSDIINFDDNILLQIHFLCILYLLKFPFSSKTLL